MSPRSRRPDAADVLLWPSGISFDLQPLIRRLTVVARMSGRCCTTCGGVIIVYADCVPLDGLIRPKVAVARPACPLVSFTGAPLLNLSGVGASAAEGGGQFYPRQARRLPTRV